MALTFITGGTRSGKSEYAQRLAEQCPGPLLYVATAGIHDGEMAERVRLHRLARGERWQTLEEPLDLAGKLPSAAAGAGAVLIDCVTLWLTNLLLHHGEDEAQVLGEVERFIGALPLVEAPLFLVSNEIGFGIVPENRLARRFRDLAGTANQRLAAAAAEAWLVVSGIPLKLK
ncbi:adenosylcobinamide kinase/adenosylcobinamide phosphate guanyltransferase [Desulfuromonas versatilis]|uniref:Adenosylcobinamide kinase n=1 Tax=Desulfuromonas versatilis TaxID=2802975 RepID=A0ABN6DX38_9BACT|nr:bifunctional adenosylcobinamide kinase/adenosylcobinamide-phosphate guanylyltransferase [Desulfuromonas versatilis]BCR03731.1 adenosylcobinamide kinase/adenosylcobinamide phosphate guanyltransferase [Desulfuromonas versatilis]